MPILGTLASQFSGKPFSSFESIASVTVGSGGSAYVEFTSIPATYTHLQIRGICQTNRADDNDSVKIQFNNDTASNYSTHVLLGTKSNGTGTSAGYANQSAGLTIAGAGNNSANVFGSGVVDILDYKNTNKYKTVKTLSGYDNNSSGFSVFYSSNWRNTDAITSIKLLPNVGSNFNQYTQFSLYGIRGA